MSQPVHSIFFQTLQCPTVIGYLDIGQWINICYTRQPQKWAHYQKESCSWNRVILKKNLPFTLVTLKVYGPANILMYGTCMCHYTWGYLHTWITDDGAPNLSTFFKYWSLVSVKVRTNKISVIRCQFWPNICFGYRVNCADCPSDIWIKDRHVCIF